MSRRINSKHVKLPNTASSSTSNLPETPETTTPKSNRKSTDSVANLSSLVFSPYSQEDDENIDIVWDWNSAQIKTRPRKHKRLDFAQSPEITIKRHPSNSQITDFIQLQQELETIKDSSCSNLSKNSIKSGSCSTKLNYSIKTDSIKATAKQFVELEDIFNDSMEDQLLICSQEVERRADLHLDNALKLLIPLTPPSHQVSDLRISTSIDKETKTTNIHTLSKDTPDKFGNDSFDQYLFSMQGQDLKSRIVNEQIEKSNKRHTNLENYMLSVEEEIERKRKEALMKRESKKSKPPSTEGKDESPIKCSPEEIEQKRLQALAKLQEKKKEDIIERNRLEALKRLERNKQKRAMQVDKTSIFIK